MLNASINSDSAVALADLHRNAYNAAFYELGFKWHWDQSIYQNLLSDSAEKERIRAYLEAYQPHLLKAYDAEFLAEAIQTTKVRCYQAMNNCGARIADHINWAEIQCMEVGV